MDGVEDKGEDQRQEEGPPASQQKVEDGAEVNILSPDVHISSSHNCQDSQAGENIWGLTRQLINILTRAGDWRWWRRRGSALRTWSRARSYFLSGQFHCNWIILKRNFKNKSWPPQYLPERATVGVDGNFWDSWNDKLSYGSHMVLTTRFNSLWVKLTLAFNLTTLTFNPINNMLHAIEVVGSILSPWIVRWKIASNKNIVDVLVFFFNIF